MDANILTTKQHYDLRNSYQRGEAAGLIYLMAHRACNNSLGGALMIGERPYNWHPELDGRTAEMKEYRAAERAMWDAIQRYDNARAAAHAKATGRAS